MVPPAEVAQGQAGAVQGQLGEQGRVCRRRDPEDRPTPVRQRRVGMLAATQTGARVPAAGSVAAQELQLPDRSRDGAGVHQPDEIGVRTVFGEDGGKARRHAADARFAAEPRAPLEGQRPALPAILAHRPGQGEADG
jgi:hypothetical protein